MGAIGRKYSVWFLAGRTEQDLHRWSLPQPCMPQPEMGVCQYGQGLGVEAWGKRVDPGRGLLLAMWRWPEGTGLKSSTAGMFLEEVHTALEARAIVE